MWKVLLSLVWLLPATCFSQSVTLAWDASPGTNVVGYTLYEGNASGQYTNRIWVGNVLIFTLSPLTKGQTYYFVATASDAEGLESEYSNEVSYTVPTDGGEDNLYPVPEILLYITKP